MEDLLKKFLAVFLVESLVDFLEQFLEEFLRKSYTSSSNPKEIYVRIAEAIHGGNSGRSPRVIFEKILRGGII